MTANRFEVRRIPLDPASTTPGSTLRPMARFAAVLDGEECASVVLGRAEVLEREPPEFTVARLSWSAGGSAAAEAVVTAAVNAAPAGAEVYFAVSTAGSANHSERREIAQGCGLSLFQEKEGFQWTDTGQALPNPTGLVVRSMAEVGREPFAPMIGRCLVGTLDRNDALVFPRHRPGEWADLFLERHAEPADERSWLLAETPDGEPVGFVGVAGRPDDPATGTVVLVGVLPEPRGRRYVDAVLLAGYRGARARGFTKVLSFVDVANHPMTAAMSRTGNDPDAHPWHKWIYVGKAE